MSDITGSPIKRFESIINNAVKESMSDVYITGGHAMVTRKIGKIDFHGAIRWSHREIDRLVDGLLNPRQLAALRARQSFDHAMTIGHARLRINIFATARGLSLAIRILPATIPTLSELNLHPSLYDIVKMKQGLVLCCGPTGVGKTTTIAGIINDINNSNALHIVMLENPIEYRFQSKKSFIQQRELGTHMPSFEQGLIDVLRENPDVIVVGELRDPATMQLTLSAAESGHLVIATMHASNPEEAIYRLCNAVPPEAQNEVRHQLAMSLQMVVVQQLVLIERAGFRVPLLTIMRGSPSIKNIIRENKLAQLNSAIQMSKSEDMFSPERYNEYLESRKSFFPYSQIFHLSREEAEDVIYDSPLLDEGEQASTPVPGRRAARVGAEPEAIVVRADFGAQETENMLTINEDESLQDLLKKMKR
jgi:pilus retraction protein PilT